MADKKKIAPDELPSDFKFDAAPDELPANFGFAPNSGLSSPKPPYIPEELRNAPPGFLARYSQMFGTQHPVDQAVSEAVQLADDPLGTSYRAAKQGVLGVRDFVYNAMLHPLQTTGGPQFAEDVQNKNYRGALGTLAGGATQVALLKAGSGNKPITSVEQLAKQELPKYAVREGGTPAVIPGKVAAVSKRGVIDDVTRALDANPKENPGIRQILLDQLDTIAKTGDTKTKRDLLGNVEKAMASDDYLGKYIKPNADVEVQVPMNYRGGTTTNFSPVNRTASVDQLHKRLATINDTLYPRFNRGGASSESAQAAIGAEQAQALTAEADAIRSTLADAIGKKMGVDPEAVRGARKNYEQLNSLREDVQASIDRDNRLSNTGTLPHNKAGAMARIMDAIWVRPQANRLIRNAFDRYDPVTTEPAEFNPQPPPLPSQRTPLWRGSADQVEQIKQLLAQQRTKR